MPAMTTYLVTEKPPDDPTPCAGVAARPADPFVLDPGALLAAFPGPVLVVTADGLPQHWNNAATALADAVRADLDGLAAAVAQVAAERLARHQRLVLSAGTGETTLDLTLLPLLAPAGRVLLLGRDATLERNMTKALLASRRLFKDLVVCAADFAFETDGDGRFSFVSPRGALGYSARELEGAPALALAAQSPPVQPFPLASRVPITGAAVQLRRKDGDIGYFEISAVPMVDETGDFCGSRGLCRDVTEARRRDAELAHAYQRLEHLSRTDPLTGLLNRRAFLDELDRRMAALAEQQLHGALFYIDVDNFKAVNDAGGHAAGDRLLAGVAEMLASRCRGVDLVARLGGDEFAVWQQGIDAAHVVASARRMQAGMAALATGLTATAPPLSLSIGIATTDGSLAAAALMQRADALMYRVKRAGKGAIELAALPAAAGRNGEGQ